MSWQTTGDMLEVNLAPDIRANPQRLLHVFLVSFQHRNAVSSVEMLKLSTVFPYKKCLAFSTEESEPKHSSSGQPQAGCSQPRKAALQPMVLHGRPMFVSPHCHLQVQAGSSSVHPRAECDPTR